MKAEMTSPTTIAPEDREFFDFVRTLNPAQQTLLLNAMRTSVELKIHGEEFEVLIADAFERMKALEEIGGAPVKISSSVPPGKSG